jgi:hypothetical protein
MRSTMAAMLCCIGPCTSRAQQNQACSWLGAQHATRHASSSTRRPSLSTLYCPTAQVGRLQCVHPQGSMASVHLNHLSLERWLQAKDGNGAPIHDYSWGIPLLGDGSQNNPHGELNGAKTIPVSFGGSGDGERSPNLLPVEPRLALHSHPSTKVEFHPSVHPKSYPSTHSPSPSSRPPP